MHHGTGGHNGGGLMFIAMMEEMPRVDVMTAGGGCADAD